MSEPYVIWTMRRTGGTTLTAFLNGLSEHPNVQHEPFNPDRIFGPITANWLKTRDRVQLEDDITKALTDRPLIKHCHELVDAGVNAALLKVTTQLGYRHMTLNRRDGAGRVMSLELAKITGVWGKAGSAKVYEKIQSGEIQLDPINIREAVAHLQFCHTRRMQNERMLATSAQPVFDIVFEDVYANPVAGAGREIVEKAVAFVGLDKTAFPNFSERLTEALVKSGQGSARIKPFVPNIDEAEAALAAAAAGLHTPDAP